MLILHSAQQLVTPVGNGKLRIVEDGAIVSDQSRILFVGATPEALHSYPQAEKMDLSGKVLLPGFVDAHTHSIFGGNRCSEFLMRLEGATYQQIAAAGGGIQSTVKATRAATEDDLLDAATNQLQIMMQYGTTSVEIKSGYGLDWECEKKILRVARQLKEKTPLDVSVTFLGAHDFPLEKSKDAYITDLLNQMIPEVAREGLAEFSDVFCDQGYYTREQTRALCQHSKSLGLKIKLHVDELADVNGAALAAEVNAVSADHLILANDEGIRKMADAGVCAVLLPGTSFSLKCKQHAPARKMIRAGVRVALATDFNPGTCFCHSMQYILQLSTLLYGLSAEEALTGATLHGAAAIDREKEIGSLEIGKQMDCLVFDIPHYGYLFYNPGVNRLETVIKKGEIVWRKKKNQN
jgi:imidazolonepropionase